MTANLLRPALRTCLLLVAATGAVASAQSLNVDQRAEALLGLGRVARDRGQWSDAAARFVESERLRPFGVTQREEHFWIVARADRARARTLAASLARDGVASPDVYRQWVALAEATGDPREVVAALDAAEGAVPGLGDWSRTRAAAALDLERAGETRAAMTAWQKVPSTAMATEPAWQASRLRLAVAMSSRAELAAELDRFSERFPTDDAMRMLAVEAWADSGDPRRGMTRLAPLLHGQARAAHLR
nr:hypothetical protein [Acidobacteriota bacterium]